MAVTSWLPLEMQLLLGRSLMVGHRICWLQPACTGEAVAGAGGLSSILWPPAFYLHHPPMLPPHGFRASCPSANHFRPLAAWERPWGAQRWWWKCLGTLGGDQGFFPSQQGHQVLV